MKINQLLTTLLAMAPSTALSAIMETGIPAEHAKAVGKVAGSLCSEVEEVGKYKVSLGEDQFYCDEESTGLVANAMMAGIDESLMASRKRSQLNVEERERGGWNYRGWCRGICCGGRGYGCGYLDNPAIPAVIEWVDGKAIN